MYLDACILVKLVSYEPDSAVYHAFVLDQSIVTSELALTEVRSALLAKERLRRISPPDRRTGWRLFQEKVRDQEFVLLPLSRQVVERAGTVIEQCHPTVPLRALDAIHVATAELHGSQVMCSTDGRVRQASDLIGLAVADLPQIPRAGRRQK